MTPPGNGDSRPPRRLILVQPADGSAARDATPSEPSTPSSSPISVRPTSPTLPPRSADLAGLSRLIAGQTATLTAYQQMQSYMAELANPTANRGYDFSLDIGANRYQIQQAAPSEPIEVTVTRPASGSGATADAPVVIRLTYLPDGRFQSSQGHTPHAAPRRGAETFFHDTLTGRLSNHASRMFQGGQLFTKIESALQALEGRFVPESQSIWHDHLVTHGGRVYSFRRMSFLGMTEIQNPQHNQIAIFEETGSEQVRVATISANGEVEYTPGRGGRDPANPHLLELLNHIVPPLEDAKVDPVAYQARLRQTLQSLPNFRGIEPSVRYSVDIPRDFSMGNTPRGHIQDFNRGWQLFRNLRSARSWTNPMNPAETAALRPPWRLSRAMSWEMVCWGRQTAAWFLLSSFRNPRPSTDHLRLQLFAEGGGQLSIYRNQELHDIVTAGPEGPAWYADQEIRQMRREGITFPNRFEALQAAVARRAQGNGASSFILRIQQAPELDLNRFHFDPNGRQLQIRNVSEAWAQLQRQIPEGIEYRVDPRFEQTIVGTLLATSGEPNRIVVDFPQSQPAMQLDIREQRIQMGNGEVPRVEIFAKRGENTYARVFENGIFREDLARDVHQTSLRQAQEGTMRRGFWARGGQGFLRAFTHVRGSGFTYGASHFASLPFVLGAERLMFTPTERRLIGTPGLEANLSPSYIAHNVVVPFGYMAVGSGLGTLAIDGLYNSRRGIWTALSNYRGTEATLSQAWRDARPSFYNGTPFVRPVSPSLVFRGFLQRATPLFGALLVFDVGQHGSLLSASNWGDSLTSARFWRQVRNVGAVSLGSAVLLRGIQASSTLSGAMVRGGLFADATTAAGARLGLSASGARFGLTFRGGLALAVLEMTALGIMSARERREQLQEAGRSLRSDLGQAIDRRNELISRLESGEEVEPRHLFSADAHVQEAQAAYRRFLELTERTEGTGNPRELGMGNDFAAEEQRYRTLQATMANDPIGLTNLESEHRRRVSELRGRYQHMEAELDQLYARYGAARTVGGDAGNESLRDFLARQAQALRANPELANQAAEASAPAATVQPPVSVDSDDGRLIVDQLRWKAAQEPGFILWSRERRADYILREFRGYSVTGEDGRDRPWNQAEALAFLDAVDSANIRRIHNLEAPLTLPTEGHGLRTANLQELLNSEQAIRARESSSHSQVSTHTEALADNVQDLDRQMAAYFRLSNERSAVALSSFLPSETVAMAHH